MGIFDDGYEQAIIDAARNPVTRPPAGFSEAFWTTYAATRQEDLSISERQNYLDKVRKRNDIILDKTGGFLDSSGAPDPVGKLDLSDPSLTQPGQPNTTVERAHQAGFIDQPDPVMLADALRGDLEGNKVYSIQGDRFERKLELQAERQYNAWVSMEEDTYHQALAAEAKNVLDQGDVHIPTGEVIERDGAEYINPRNIFQYPSKAETKGLSKMFTSAAAAAAAPIGGALIVVRNDARTGSLTSADGDNIALRGTNSGELYVKQTDAVPASQSGTWTVQPGNTANTTAWKVDGSAVTQPISGTVTVTDGAGALNVIVDSGTTIVTQATGTNLHVVVDTAPSTAVTNAGTFAVQATLAAGAAPSGSMDFRGRGI